MAAPPPPPPPPPLVVDDDDGFDWEAAVREIDTACSLASTSAAAAAASASVLPPKPSAKARQATLDRFVDSFTRRKQAKERAAAVVTSAGGGRLGARAGDGCSGEAKEMVQEACAVVLDAEAAQTWIYPTNVDVREYQLSFVQKALFTNTLVALPTGLGKTFIAAVVMYNYFRWFPEGKIVFTAPSRPLVAQQIEACHNTVGIPQKWTIDMTGHINPSKRSNFWESKRVFFVTPQILEKDIQSGICMVKHLVCLVIDEAHRALGNHSYCVAVRELMAAHVPLRILALTATPGSKHLAIRSVINNLCISELAHRDEDDPDVSRYVHNRKIELVKVPLGSDAAKINDIFLNIIEPHVSRLRATGVLPYRDAATWSPHELLILRDKFRQAPPPNIPHAKKGEIEGSFGALCTLYHIRKLLFSHGIRPAYELIQDKLKEGPLQRLMAKNEPFWNAKMLMEQSLSTGVPSPKIQKMMEVLVDHFNKNNSKDSRVIIFSHFRESVKEIMCSLGNIGDGLVKATEFIGQSSGKRLKGQTQKVQQAVLQKFRSGGYNVIVATSIGEEGLDIMEVDLVICFDANISPLRMIQRMGRTGRKHDGQVVVLACEGQELKGYLKKQANSRSMRKLLRNRESFEYHASPRMVPHIYKPEVKFVELSIEKYISHCKKIKVNAAGTSPILNKISDEESQLLARYFGMCKEDTWKPSLVAFPSFQVSPCDVYKVPHSFRTTAMLIDAMQQLQDLSIYRTKVVTQFEDLADVASAEDQAEEDSLSNKGFQLAMHHDKFCGMEASSKEVQWGKSVSVSTTPIKKYPVHSFLFSGDYVSVDTGGCVSITFVPVLPITYAFQKDKKNEINELYPKSWNGSAPCKLTKNINMPAIEFDHPADANGLDKPTFAGNEWNLVSRSPEFAEQSKHADDKHELKTLSSKTGTSPRENCETPYNAKLAIPASSGAEDMELSPRLTHYIEEGIVPESPVLEVSNCPLKIDITTNQSFAPKVGSLKSHEKGSWTNVAGCQEIPFYFDKNREGATGIFEPAASPRKYLPDHIQTTTEVPMCPLNKKISTPEACIPTENQLCDSFSEDLQFKSRDASDSVQQAPKYRRLCKYGDKIKRVSSISLDGRYEEFIGEQHNLANRTISNQMERAKGNKEKAKKRLDTYIDEEAEVSEDAEVSDDEDNDENEDKYEDSFINDQTIPTGQFTQTEQGGENAGDMLAFYRHSLLTQSPVVLPSRYLDASDNSASRTGTASCSSEKLHSSTETPEGIPPTCHSTDPSPLSYQRSCIGRTSCMYGQSKTKIVECESSTKLDCRKRKLSFQQAASVPIINLEPPAQPSSNLASAADDVYMDDTFYQSLDLDAIEAQATELLRVKAVQSTQKTMEIKQVPETSYAAPSFDLGF